MLTATLAPHVALYVHKSLSLMKDTCLVRRCVDRRNIFLARRAIHNSSSYEELEFVLPKTIRSLDDIPNIIKTMIFLDSRLAVCKVTDHLLLRLKAKLADQGNQELPTDVIGDFSMALSLERREELLEKFRRGECRILVATEGAGMGIDIPDVQRVIQWQCTKILNIATYYQRAGRAGRSHDLQSVSILFYQQSLGCLEGEYEIFTKDVNSESGAEIMLLTQNFDSGRDDDAMIRKGKSSTRTMLANRGKNPQVNGQHQKRQSDSRRAICRGILTQIGTQGCMRDAILRYFDDSKATDISPNRCCDSCAVDTELDIPLEIRRLMPEYVPPELDPPESENITANDNLGETASGGTLGPGKSSVLPKVLHISQAQINAVRDALRMLRNDILQSQWDNPEDTKKAIFRSSHFLDDKEIHKISSQAHRIYDEKALAKYLNTHKHALQWAPIAPYVNDVLETIAHAFLLHPPLASGRQLGRRKCLLSAEEEAVKKEQARIARNTRQRERYALRKAQFSALLQNESIENSSAQLHTSIALSESTMSSAESRVLSNLTSAVADSVHAGAHARTPHTVSAPVGALSRTPHPNTAHAGILVNHPELRCANHESHENHFSTIPANSSLQSMACNSTSSPQNHTSSANSIQTQNQQTSLNPIPHPLQEITNQIVNALPQSLVSKPKRSYKRKIQPHDAEDLPHEPLPKRPRGRPRNNPIITPTATAIEIPEVPREAK